MRMIKDMWKMRCWIIISLIFLGHFEIKAGNPIKPSKSRTTTSPYTLINTPWADSVFNSLNLDGRIAQLFLAASYSNKDKKHIAEVAELIEKYNIGGVIFFQGGPVRQAIQTNYYQSKAKTPLMIGIDGEWGLGMRLDSTIIYPRQMMLGALKNEELIFEMGEDIASQMKRMGIHINFAPVVDINNNPDNPVISNRSFGENRNMVTNYSLAYMLGLQNNHILSVAKHFPGHGDTDVDSHQTLPVIHHTYNHLDSFELYPYRQLIECNLGGIMVAHLCVPELDSTKNLASSLSKRVVTSMLLDSLQFKGLVFTDALNMKGVTSYFSSGELEVRALEAGNDVLVMPVDIPLAIAKVKEAVLSGRISVEQINRSCKKVLIFKEWAGLPSQNPVKLTNLVNDLNSAKSKTIVRRIVENSLTVVKNNNNLIPVKNLSGCRIATVSVGDEPENEFSRTIDLYSGTDHFSLSKKTDSTAVNQLLNDLKQYNLIIIGVMSSNYSPVRNYGVSMQSINFLNRVPDVGKVILNIFTPPYFLNRISTISKYQTVIVSYEDTPVSREYAAQLIFGGISSSGKLPVSITGEFSFQQGITSLGNTRFKYTIPEDINISSQKLESIDSIVNDAIHKKVMPGCEILAAKNGVVFYQKAFGYHTYDSINHVKMNDLYDLASVTKITATLPSVMKLYESGAIKLKRKLSDYLPELKNTNKNEIILLDMLTHQSKLQPFIPFYMDLMQPENKKEKLTSNTPSDVFSIQLGHDEYVNKNTTYKPGYFTKKASFFYENQVADSLYVLSSFEDSIFDIMAQSPLLSKKEYKYSDMGFIYLYKIVQNQTGIPFQEYVRQNFYARLGATTTGYLPLQRYEKNQIAPTEDDLFFRHQLIQGYVHDPGAALMGGVSGHAGLFSDANDIAKVMQMYLNGGIYGGERYFEQPTLDYFNSTPYITTGNRRGIGFDKPETNPQKPNPTSNFVSAKSFGHSGFTGTYVWADPETGLLYVFLSNRVYPNAENNKIIEMSIRTKILDVLAQSIKENNL
jgi:beta-N-acetylhexosaminidase